MARCPECNAKLVIAPDAGRWDRIFCTICNVELEVIDLHPLNLEVIYDFEDDENALDQLEEDGEDLTWENTNDE